MPALQTRSALPDPERFHAEHAKARSFHTGIPERRHAFGSIWIVGWNLEELSLRC
jgi:hypothetical protein